MFIETHVDTVYTDNIPLTFLKSSAVQVFPCGRRRSSFISADQNKDGLVDADEGYRIPFDPEARLNTEANNRKHSSLNGYTQTYLKHIDIDNKELVLALGGYLFTVTLTDYYTSVSDFGNTIIDNISSFDKNFVNDDKLCIYANILIENVKLFSGFKNYYTGVLHNQSADSDEPVLDLLCEGQSQQNEEGYYFSGLSFSTVPLTKATETSSVINNDKQTIISLCLLEKLGVDELGVTEWVVHEPAYLPKISHGRTPDSVKVKELFVDDTVTTQKLITKELYTDDVQTKTLTASDSVTSKVIYTDTLGSKETPVTNIFSTDHESDNIIANTITANEKTVSPEFKQVIDKIEYPVPVISIKAQTDGTYQLQLSRVYNE